MALTDKYQQLIASAKQANVEVEEKGGMLHLKGTLQTVPEKNRIWDAIKAVPGWEQEVTADIRVTEAGMAAWKTAPADEGHTYTVKAGDTLSKIAKQHLGDANAYMDIYNANRNLLSDPDRIKPGQVLTIPQPTKH